MVGVVQSGKEGKEKEKSKNVDGKEGKKGEGGARAGKNAKNGYGVIFLDTLMEMDIESMLERRKWKERESDIEEEDEKGRGGARTFFSGKEERKRKKRRRKKRFNWEKAGPGAGCHRLVRNREKRSGGR